MYATILAVTLGFLAGPANPASPEMAALFATIETLQHPVEDMQCEFEGRLRFMGVVAVETAKTTKLGDDGIYETVSGRFRCTRGGDVATDIFHQAGADGMISRETVVVRAAENQAEQYLRGNDAPLGAARIKKPKEVDVWSRMSASRLYLLEQIKNDIANGFATSVHDDQFDGRPCKVVEVASKERSWLIKRYWIDLARTGHAFRSESYSPEGARSGWTEVKFERFQVGAQEVWMPVSSESAGYVAAKDGLPIFTKEQTSSTLIWVVGGTMLLNQHPGREAFSIKYKPGTPISDTIRQMETEYGQNKVPPRPTKVEATRMLDEQLKRAEEQKSELVAVPASGGTNWLSWAAGGFLVLTVTGLWVYQTQNRRRY